MKKTNDINIRKIVRNKYNNHCAYCGCILTDKNFTIDHIEPKRRNDYLGRKGGPDSIENFNPCCLSCNSSKHTLSIEKWRKELENKFDRLLRDSATFRILYRFSLISKKNEVIFYFEKHEPNLH